jgi:hypothetical protein
MSFTPTNRSLGINWNEVAKRLANVQLDEWASQNASLIAAVPGELDNKFSAFTLEWKRLMMEAVLAEALSCYNLYLKRTPEVTDTRVFSFETLNTYVDPSGKKFMENADDVDMDLLTEEVAEWLQSLLPQAEWHKIPTALNSALPAFPGAVPGHTLKDDAEAIMDTQPDSEAGAGDIDNEIFPPPEDKKELKARQALGLMVKVLMASAPNKYCRSNEPNRKAIAASMLAHVDDELWQKKAGEDGSEREIVKGFSESTLMGLVKASYNEWCQLENSKKRMMKKDIKNKNI